MFGATADGRTGLGPSLIPAEGGPADNALAGIATGRFMFAAVEVLRHGFQVVGMGIMAIPIVMMDFILRRHASMHTRIDQAMKGNGCVTCQSGRWVADIIASLKPERDAQTHHARYERPQEPRVQHSPRFASASVRTRPRFVNQWCSGVARIPCQVRQSFVERTTPDHCTRRGPLGVTTHSPACIC